MRRICCVALILALLFGGIAQSQPVFAESKDDDVPTLCMVHYMEPNGIEPYDQKLRALFRRFTDETGIRISIKTMSWDQLDEMLLVSSQFNEPLGDLFMLSSQKLEYLVNGGALMPLDDFFDATFQRDEFLPYALEAGTSFFDGRLYLMLQSLHCRGLWYNRKYVAEPPETLDEVLNLSLALMQEHEDLYGLGFWGGSHYGAVEATLNMLTWAFGGRLSDGDGQACWDNDAVVSSIRLINDWVYRYGISPEICLTTADGQDVQEMFYEGELAMIFDGSFAYSRSESALKNLDDFGFAPMPGIDGPASNFSNGWAWGIPVNSAQPELAWRFIEWFESEEIQTLHALAEGALPVRRDSLADPRLEECGYMESFIEVQTRFGRPMDPFVYYNDAMDALTTIASEYALDPEMDLKAALTEARILYNRKFYP